ncbi:MAG: ATP-binding cassette domain-containing protein [Aquiluna sp.]|nr:ATP-binding cassette domain-containing protein [Aquiluna sp.]
MSEVINLQNVSVVRGGETIIDSLTFQADSSERWVVLGANGAGKTTLLKLAAAQIQPNHGTATLLGQSVGSVNVFELRTRIGFASSSQAAQISNSESVLNAVMTASYGVTGRRDEAYDSIDERRARRVLGEWELSDFENRAFGTLSDGERKRVQIARSIMTDPELLLLDEPVASLDLASRELTIQLLSGYAKSSEAPAMVMVTHHLEEIPAGFTHALILQDGKVMARGEIGATLTSASISEAFKFPLVLSHQNGRYSASAS